jgi:tetratricopeptide (TPR) repeat protein
MLKGRYADALCHYNHADVLCPDSVSCRGNRAATLIGLGRLIDALRECEEAIQLDLLSGSAHNHIANLYLR